MNADPQDTDTVLLQHVIDPEICIRCYACEEACPIDAITHDDTNVVVDSSICEKCKACIPVCPTGSIDNWRLVSRAKTYTVEEQLGWDELPEELPPEEVGEAATDDGDDTLVPQAVAEPQPQQVSKAQVDATETPFVPGQYNATLPPWSGAHAYTNLYGPKTGPTQATVVGNRRVTAMGREYDTHHIMLDFGSMPFPVLEGQSIGIIPPGLDERGKAYFARQFSVASPRNGERPGFNNVSLTVKRVLEDHQGRPCRGVASNYVCDLKIGDTVKVIGPFGDSFIMPNHPRSNIVMICTGTGSAPMRAMTEWRRRLRASGKFEGGRLVLFFGARTQEDLPYYGPLLKLPKDFIDIHFAYSRTPGQPKKYVQDAMRENAADLAPLLADPNTYFYVCGLKAMEEGVMLALREVATNAGLNWEEIGTALRDQGRLHLETY